MTGPYITAEFSIGSLSGTQHCTHIIEAMSPEARVKGGLSITANSFDSGSTEAGEGCLIDIQLHVLGEKQGDTDKYQVTEISVTLNKSQAKALRNQINAFLEYD